MSLALVRSCLGLCPLQCPLSFLLYFKLLVYYYSGVCFILLLHLCSFHAQGILCGIHTTCMRSPFLIFHAKWTLVFLSLATFSQRLKTVLNLVYNVTIDCSCFFISKCPDTPFLSEGIFKIQYCITAGKFVSYRLACDLVVI